MDMVVVIDVVKGVKDTKKDLLSRLVVNMSIGGGGGGDWGRGYCNNVLLFVIQLVK